VHGIPFRNLAGVVTQTATRILPKPLTIARRLPLQRNNKDATVRVRHMAAERANLFPSANWSRTALLGESP